MRERGTRERESTRNARGLGRDHDHDNNTEKLSVEQVYYPVYYLVYYPVYYPVYYQNMCSGGLYKYRMVG